jgi:hypothetical protein
VCDPLEASCKDDGMEIYVRDTDIMYCGDEAVECGCSRSFLRRGSRVQGFEIRAEGLWQRA